MNQLPEMNRLVQQLAVGVQQAGQRLLDEYTVSARPVSKPEMATAAKHLEGVVTDILRSALAEIRPGARWIDDEQETTVLPPGEWWAVDAIEGGVNYVHGMDQWAVTVALVSDNEPVLAVVYQPVGDRTWTAVRGGGAFLNGSPLTVSAKTDLDAAIVTMTQPRSQTRRFGDAIGVLLDHVLFIRSTVPSTFPQLDLAAGHVDAYWQYECDVIGVAAGILLATEAGGVVTNLNGEPWQPGHTDILAAAPGLHHALLTLLQTEGAH